jgi:sulfite exporter TauE/SafE
LISVSLLASAFALGLLAMPHCGSMCACQFAAPWLRKPLYFQAGRFLAYTAGGALAGGISSGVLGMASNGIQVFQALNWMLMSVLAFSAVLLLWRGQSLGVLVQERIQLPPALQRKLGAVQQVSPVASFKAGLLWLLMPCGVLWAGFMLAYIAGSPLQGALIMAVFALTSGAGLQLVSSLRQALSGRVGDALMLRASGLIILLGLGVMLGRQAGFISSPVWMESMGFCL